MKNNKNNNVYKKTLTSLLFEQEEKDEEATEEEGGETAEEETDEEVDDNDEESTAEDETTEEGPPPAENSSLDDDIEAVLIDFESNARKEAATSVSEHKIATIYEQAEELDIGSFAADVARLVKNYDNLLDIEQLLVKKSKDFISNRYDEETASMFIDELEIQHDLEIEKDISNDLSSVTQVPLAVGATSAGE